MARKTLTQINSELLEKIDSLQTELVKVKLQKGLLSDKWSKVKTEFDAYIEKQAGFVTEVKSELAEAHANEVRMQKRLREALGEVGRLAAERDRFAVEIARQVTTAKD